MFFLRKSLPFVIPLIIATALVIWLGIVTFTLYKTIHPNYRLDKYYEKAGHIGRNMVNCIKSLIHLYPVMSTKSFVSLMTLLI